jgi:hypothetical protein
VLLLSVATASGGEPVSSSATNHHCNNEQALYATKQFVVARETTEASDMYVTCWRKSNKHRVVAKFAAENRQQIAFRAKGEWVVWRYSTAGIDRMGSLNARTGRRGPRVAVPTPAPPFELSMQQGPVAQDIGDAGVLGVWIASNGFYAWPVSGVRPSDEGGQSATAMYVAAGHGRDTRIDIGAGPQALDHITIRGTTLRWHNNGAHKRAHLGPQLHARALARIMIGAGADATTSGPEIGRSQVSGPTKRDPNLTAGTFTLRVRGHDLVARWHGTVRHSTRMDFLISPTTKRGSNLPGFHGEPPHQSTVKHAGRGHGRTLTAVFRHPRVVRGWPCVTGYIIDEPPGLSRVYPLGPFVVRLLCPRGGFGLA